jgi:hypothetical protein
VNHAVSHAFHIVELRRSRALEQLERLGDGILVREHRERVFCLRAARFEGDGGIRAADLGDGAGRELPVLIGGDLIGRSFNQLELQR